MPQKSTTSQPDSNPIAAATPRVQTDGAVFMVHRQPIALDRFTLHDVRPPDAVGEYYNRIRCFAIFRLINNSSMFPTGDQALERQLLQPIVGL